MKSAYISRIISLVFKQIKASVCSNESLHGLKLNCYIPYPQDEICGSEGSPLEQMRLQSESQSLFHLCTNQHSNVNVDKTLTSDSILVEVHG